MERKEMIEILMAKAKVNREEAEEALERCNLDVLDAIIYLERKGKIENNDTTTIINVEGIGEENDSKENNDHKEKFGGIGDIIGRIFRLFGRFLKKGNENFFEIRKENTRPMRISIVISILLLIFFTIPSVILLIVGLFCGYKYSISGPKANYEGVNSVFEEVSKSAEGIKNDFKEGYNN